MTKSYLVVRNGVSKKTGAVYSLAQKICQMKDGGAEFLNENDKYVTNDIRPVGTIIQVEQMEV